MACAARAGRETMAKLRPGPLQVHRLVIQRDAACVSARGDISRSLLEDAEVALELPGRDLDAVVLPLLALDLDEAVEGVLAERAQHVALLDPLEAGLEQHRERQVRVAGGVGAAQLHPRGVLLARVVERDADE